MTEIFIGFTALMIVFGVLWHDQPAEKHEHAQNREGSDAS